MKVLNPGHQQSYQVQNAVLLLYVCLDLFGPLDVGICRLTPHEEHQVFTSNGVVTLKVAFHGENKSAVFQSCL